MRRLRPSLALVALTLALGPAAGCTPRSEAGEGAAAEQKAAPAKAAETQPAEPGASGGVLKALAEEPKQVEPAPPPEIKVIDAGAEPRVAMRAKVSAGQEQPMIMTMTIGMSMNVAGSATPYIKMPPTVMDMRTKVTSVSSNGDFRYEFDLRGIDVEAQADTPPDLVVGLKSALSGMVGMRGSSVVSERGEVREADFQLPPNAPPQVQQQMQGMRQSIQQIAVPFPEEAVGLGAKWEVIARIPDLNGMSLTQTATYEMLERDGDRIKLRTTMAQSADPQIMKAPGMPPGATVRLESMASSGAGETLFDMHKLVPISATMSLSSKISMLIDTGVQKQPMNMAMDMSLAVKGE